MYPMVNLRQAKARLSQLIMVLEQGEEREIIIARNGRPVAKLVPMAFPPDRRRIGAAKGAFEVPDDIDTSNEEVAHLFLGRASS